jgi:Macrocin-O-methyltransferase (TylF)
VTEFATSAQPATMPHMSRAELAARARMGSLLRETPIPTEELSKNLLLYLRREMLADVLAMDGLYRRILDVPGSILEFGVRWGRRLGLFTALRELYEPYNFNRRVYGFDTFSGLPATSAADGHGSDLRPGALAVSPGYQRHLEDALAVHESESLYAHIRRFGLLCGDVGETLPGFLEAHPDLIIAMAYFDLDLYEPTRVCLELIQSRLVGGSVIAFDELADPRFPGETAAARDILDLPTTRVERFPFHPYPAFIVV